MTKKEKITRISPDTQSKLDQVRELMVETDMTVQQIADDVGLHISTIYRHLPAVRMKLGPRPAPPKWRQHARELLLNTDLTPREVAKCVDKSLSTLYMFVPVRELRQSPATNKQENKPPENNL